MSDQNSPFLELWGRLKISEPPGLIAFRAHSARSFKKLPSIRMSSHITEDAISFGQSRSDNAVFNT